MEYRNIETLGAAPSLLGYGCMRFPTLDDESIDEPQARRLLDRAIEGGVNYFDTAYFYHKGASENFMSRALAQYPRGELLPDLQAAHGAGPRSGRGQADL